MIDYDKVLKLIDAIYGAGLDQTQWAPVLAQVADAVGASDALLGVMDSKATPFMVAARSDPEFQTSYMLHYHSLDLFWQRGHQQRAGQIFTVDMLIPRDEFEKSAFYNEWALPQGYKMGLGTTMALTETHRYELGLTSKRQFDTDTLKLVEILSPHIARSAQVTGLVSAAQATTGDFLTAFDGAGKSAMLIDVKGRVLLASPAAERLLSEGRGLSVRHGLLVAGDAGGNREIRRLFETARNGMNGGASLSIPRPHQAPLSILAIPISTEIPWGPSYADLLLVVTDPEGNMSGRNARFGAYYGLTAAELGIAVEISRGGSRSEVAKRRGISDATARSQLSSIFDKTGVRRQADLVRLLHQFL